MVYCTTTARELALQGDINFDTGKMGGFEALWRFCGRRDVKRIVTCKEKSFRVEFDARNLHASLIGADMSLLLGKLVASFI